ncbi:hypothetical protein ACEU2D_20025 [Brevibacillus laterosporus]|uniref:hypothetical protein n=1 Tax=Brevibacillus laterosporus TaxID=1465 RepID=UPI0035A5AB13
MKRILFLALALFLAGCSTDIESKISGENKSFERQEESIVSKEKSGDENSRKDRLNQLKNSIKGSIFIKEFSVTKDRAVITYVNDYHEFKVINPEGKVTEKNYLNYWKTDDQINKVLMSEPIRIFREIPGIKEVDMVLPLQGIVYRINWNKKEAEKYFNIDFKHYSNDQSGKLFEKEFIDSYVYDRVQREKFSQLFIDKKPNILQKGFLQKAENFIGNFNNSLTKIPDVFDKIYPEFITGKPGKILFFRTTNLIGIIGSLDDKNQIKEVRVVGITNDSDISFQEILVSQYFTIIGLDSSLSDEDVEEFLIGLGMDNKEKVLKGISAEIIKKGVKYQLISNRSEGIKLIIQKAM